MTTIYDDEPAILAETCEARGYECCEQGDTYQGDNANCPHRHCTATTAGPECDLR